MHEHAHTKVCTTIIMIKVAAFVTVPGFKSDSCHLQKSVSLYYGLQDLRIQVCHTFMTQ